MGTVNDQKRPTGDGIPAGSGKIELRLRDLRQLYNSMDPSPFREKDLDDDAEEFIVSWAKEYPTEKSLALLVHLDSFSMTAEAVAAVADSIHVFFQHRADMTTQRLHQLFRVGRTSMLIGVIFLTVCLLIADWIDRTWGTNRFAGVAHESLVIGGWVAMWRPLEIFLYDWWPIRNERRVFDRLARMPVKIVCSGKDTLPGEAVTLSRTVPTQLQ
jgi:hypothetical protein